MTRKIRKRLVIALVIIIIIFLLFGILNVQTKILKIIYPQDYNDYVEKYSTQYNVNEYLIFAIMKAESNFKVDAQSSKGAKGLMQLMDKTAKDINKKIDVPIQEGDISSKLLEAEYNINLGTKYISILIEKYNNIEIALTAYNAGIGTVDTWIENGTLKSDGTDIENIPYKETNNYVRKIMRDYKIYNELY